MEQHSDGFTYESSDKQKRSAVKLLIIELMAVFVSGIVILILLQVTGIVKIFNWGNKKATDVTPTVVKQAVMYPTPVVDEQIIPEVSAVSDILSFQINIQKKDELISLLKKWRVFGRTYENANKTFTKEPLRKIIFHLTDKVQQGYQYKDTKGNIYLSSSLAETSPGVFEIYTYLSPNLLTNPKAIPDNSFQNESLRTIYFQAAMHEIIQQPSLNNQTEKIFDQIMMEMGNGSYFFHVEKKS